MQILQAIFLGLIQGLTEFIPVSSSGHLVLAERLFNFEISGFVFDAVLNIGTIAALVIYFRNDLWQMLRSLWAGDSKRRLVGFIAIATVPGVIAGMLLQDLAETTLRSEYIVVAMLSLVAILMLVVDKYLIRKRQLNQMKIKDSLAVGIAQALAFMPGTSRSGITITAGAALGFTREAAAKFSFYLAIPILSGGVLKVLIDNGFSDEVTSHLGSYIAGTLAAFISGYIAVAFLIGYLKKHGLSIFAYYRLILAAIILLITVFTR